MSRLSPRAQFKTWHFTSVLRPCREITRVLRGFANDSQYTDKVTSPIVEVRNWVQNLQGCSERRVDPGIRRTRAAAAGASGWPDSPLLLHRRPAVLIGPGRGAALPSRPDGASSGACPPPPPARAGERHCPPARTVQAAGDSDQVRPPLRRQPAALTGPGRGATLSSRPDGASRR